MAKVTMLPLYKDAAFEYQCSLQGNNFKLRFYVNVRQNRYHFDILTDDDTEVLTGLSLLALAPICSEYDLSDFGLTGYFYLGLNNNDIVFSELDTDFIADYCFFCYVHEE